MLRLRQSWVKVGNKELPSKKNASNVTMATGELPDGSRGQASQILIWDTDPVSL